MLSGVEAAEFPADAIEVGRITDAWGVKGWFKVLPYSSSPDALVSSKSWFVLPAEKGVKAFSGPGRVSVVQAKFHSGSIVAAIDGVGDRTGAEALRGVRIFIPRTNFPTVQNDEYYWVDLIGLKVINREGVDLGVVKELLPTGAQTVLVMEYVDDDKVKERLIPFVSVYIDDVNVPSQRILVDWQADY